MTINLSTTSFALFAIISLSVSMTAMGLVIGDPSGGGNPATPTSSATQGRNPAYVACCKDGDLSQQMYLLNPLTTEFCINTCGALGFAFAGTQRGNQCWCGNSNCTQGVFDEAYCNVPCSGDETQICGGIRKNSIYKTPARHIGCLNDRRDFPYSAYKGHSTNSPESCILTCRRAGYSFAAMQNAKDCYCGNTWSVANVAPSSASCNLPCPGNTQYLCGGSAFINIWRA